MLALSRSYFYRYLYRQDDDVLTLQAAFLAAAKLRPRLAGIVIELARLRPSSVLRDLCLNVPPN
jgi:hypothetical protein